jgi:hypothetical protein
VAAYEYTWRQEKHPPTKENEMTTDTLVPDPISLSESLAIPPLTAHDYCDSGCGQVAYVRIEVAPDKYIDLCAHHYHVNEVELAVQGYRVLDERERLAAAERAYKGQA